MDQEIEPHEPNIVIDGVALTNAQSMSVRVAITLFHMQCSEEEYRTEMGSIADGYRARLAEVIKIMLAGSQQ